MSAGELLAQLPFLPKEEQDMYLEYPALAHPEGNKPQFENPPNQNATGYGVIGLMLFMASFSVLARLYVKIFSTRKVNIEEFIMLAAFGPYIGFIWCAFNIPEYAGFYVHQWDISLRDLQNVRWIVHIGSICYSFTNPLIKTAILLEWTRIFVPTGTRNAFFWTCWTMIAGLLMLVIGGVTAVFLECRPYDAIWKFTVPNPTCIDKGALEISTASMHLIFDVMVLLLPQKVIWSLQMNIKQKIGVSIMFSVGMAACASATFRLVSNTDYASSPDVTYTLSPVVFACIAEMTCGFIIFGTPTFPRAFKDNKIASSIRSGFKSLTGKSTAKSSQKSGNSRGQGLPRSQNSVDAYQKLDESSVALGKISAVKKSSYSSESTEHLYDLPRAQGPAIVRTTKFTTSEERVPTTQRGKREFGRQHPWEGGV